MEVQSRYVLSALDCIRVGLLHYELRDRMLSRARAAVQLSTASEHLLRERLRLMGDSRHDDWISYSGLVGLLVPTYVWPQEARSLRRLRDFRDAVLHDAAQIYGERLSDFDGAATESLRFLERFLRRALQIDAGQEFNSCLVSILRGDTLDFHDKADLRSKAAVDAIMVEHDVEEAVELANEAFDLAIRAVACGIGLPAESGATDDVVDLMRQQGQNNEAYYFLHDEYADLKPGVFQKHGASFSDVSEVEEYVRQVREVVIDLLDRAHRPRWEARVRERWPHVVALVRQRFPETSQRIPEDPEGVTVTGTQLRLGGFVRNSGPELHEQVVMAALRREVPELPREFTVSFGPCIIGRTVYLSDDEDG